MVFAAECFDFRAVRLKHKCMKVHTFNIRKKVHGVEVDLYPTLIKVNGRHYLVDCGYEETFEEFTDALRKLGVSVDDLYAILISHDDIDHLGALKLFKDKNPDAVVLCSEIEEPSVAGRIKSERLEQAERSLEFLPEEHKGWAVQFIEQLKNIQRVDVDETLKNHDSIEDEIEVIYTPGHTKGHISFYIKSEATVIANDALVIEEDDFNIANPAFTLDMDQAIKSVELIKAINPRKIICYHGGIATTNILEGLRKLVSKYSGAGRQNF